MSNITDAKEVTGNTKYLIHPNGDVYSTIQNRFLKRYKGKTGYFVVNLSHANHKTTIYKLHRLIAIAFIDNPENKKYVNHKDGVKTNNEISNLEWCTSSENNFHAWRTGLKKMSDKTMQKFILRVRAATGCNSSASRSIMNYITREKYVSVKHASETIGMNRNTLTGMIKGYNKNRTNLVLYDESTKINKPKKHKMDKNTFVKMITAMQRVADEDGIEDYLRSLKNYFNDNQVTDIEDKIFGLNEQLTSLSLDEFYEYLQTKS